MTIDADFCGIIVIPIIDFVLAFPFLCAVRYQKVQVSVLVCVGSCNDFRHLRLIQSGRLPEVCLWMVYLYTMLKLLM